MRQSAEIIRYLVGSEAVSTRPLVPYSRVACSFLASLSAELMRSDAALEHPDVKTFGFWCRRGNISRLKTEFEDGKTRLGRGGVFHVTPSNVPVSFAFSFAFGLLSGNANIVRVPSRPFPQVEIISEAIRKVFRSKKFSEVERMTSFLRYDRDDHVTADLSANCDARIIWGGDATIRHLRSFPVPERCVDIVFPDRYSLCIMDAASVNALNDDGLKRLVSDFYNDTYLMDQNACSSPHLVIWQGGGPGAAQERFWPALHEVVTKKYDLAPINAVDKYNSLCEHAIDFNQASRLEKHGNALYRIVIDSLPDNMDTFRGRAGLFYEYDAPDLVGLAHVVNTKYQTLTYFGIDKSVLSDFVLEGRLRGIDRIVPIGRALNMDVVWDGYDIVKNLSRIIDVR